MTKGDPRLVSFLVGASLALASACGERAGDGSGAAQGGSSGAAGTPAAPIASTAGAGGSAATAGSGGAPITSMAGGGGSSGSSPAAGAGASGSAGSGGSSGGAPDDAGLNGAGGTSPVLDAGDAMAAAPTPSAGCSRASPRPSNGLVSVTDSHYLAFPESYDGTRPFPVLVGFHGCGAVNRGTSAGDTEWMRLTDGTDFETEYVRVVPVSADSGGCWSYATDLPRITQIHDTLLADYCVDESRVFATGHSSGAQLVVQILLQSHAADAEHFAFAGVAPVAASDYGPIQGPIAVMYIQGMMDSERGNGDGHETVERFRAANGCADTSTPYSSVAGCQSGATQVTPGCVIYDGCDARTVWCSHDDPAYSGTMHGVPCFGITAMHDFFESLR